MDHEDGDGDGAGLDGGVDGDSGGGMEEPSRGDTCILYHHLYNLYYHIRMLLALLYHCFYMF